MIQKCVVIKRTKYFWMIQKNNDTNVCCHEDDDVKLWYKCVLYHEVDKVLFDDIIYLLQYNDDTRHYDDNVQYTWRIMT